MKNYAFLPFAFARGAGVFLALVMLVSVISFVGPAAYAEDGDEATTLPVEEQTPAVEPTDEPVKPVEVAKLSSSNIDEKGKICVVRTPKVTLTVPVVDDEVYPTGKVKFTLQRKVSGKWKTVETQTVKFASKKNKVAAKLSKATVTIGSYRYKAAYAGDNNYEKIVTAYNDFEAIKLITRTVTAHDTRTKYAVYAKASSKSKKVATHKSSKSITVIGMSGKYYKVPFKLKGKAKTGYIPKAKVHNITPDGYYPAEYGSYVKVKHGVIYLHMGSRQDKGSDTAKRMSSKILMQGWFPTLWQCPEDYIKAIQYANIVSPPHNLLAQFYLMAVDPKKYDGKGWYSIISAKFVLVK